MNINVRYSNKTPPGKARTFSIVGAVQDARLLITK